MSKHTPGQGGQYIVHIVLVLIMFKIPISLLCYYYNTSIYKGQPLLENRLALGEGLEPPR